MGKVIIPRVPSIGTVTGVSDSAARQILQPLVDAHNTRNGDTGARFVTAAELAERLSAVSQPASTTTTTVASDDERIERLSGELAALQDTVARSNATSTNDGYSVGHGSGNVPINNGTLNNNLNADLLDGFHAGHDSGDVPVSDSSLCTDLNADLLDGMHASELVHVGAVVTATKTATGKFMEVTLDSEVFYIPLYQ